jgi:calcium/proton exchanger cax
MASPSQNPLGVDVPSHESAALIGGRHTNEAHASTLGGGGSSLWTRPPRYLYDTTMTTMYSSKVNLLLFLVPLSIVAESQEWGSVSVFILSFLAIFPLAELLSWSTEQLAGSTGQIVGGLLNATFGNAVEMIVGRASAPSPCLILLTLGVSRLALQPSSAENLHSCSPAWWVASSQEHYW